MHQEHSDVEPSVAEYSFALETAVGTLPTETPTAIADIPAEGQDQSEPPAPLSEEPHQEFAPEQIAHAQQENASSPQEEQQDGPATVTIPEEPALRICRNQSVSAPNRQKLI
jgi:hypothetical protein